MKYICDDCHQEKTTSKNKIPNPDTNKMLCQRCSCKYTNQRISKRKKNSKTLKVRYKSGELDHIKEKFRKQRIEYNKTIQPNKLKSKSKKEKQIVAQKKRNTFYKRTLKERQEINYRRTSAFRKYNELKSKLKIEWLESLSEEQKIILREYSYVTKQNWKKIRNYIINECNNICVCCNTKINKRLDIHHIIPFVLQPNNKELIPLCRKCHINIEWAFRHKYIETQNIKESKHFSIKDLKKKKIYNGDKIWLSLEKK